MNPADMKKTCEQVAPLLVFYACDEVDAAEASLIEMAMTVLGGYRAVASIERVSLLQEVRGTDGRRWTPLADACFGRPAVVGTGSPFALELVRSQLVDPEAGALLEAEGLDHRSTGAMGAVTRYLVVTARRPSGVVGVAAAWLTPDGGNVAVFVASPHRKEGIGTHLLAAVESAVIDAGWGCTSLRGVGPPGFYGARSRTTRSGSTSTG